MFRINRVTTAVAGIMTSAVLTVGIAGCTAGGAEADPTHAGVEASAAAETPAPETTSPEDEAVELAEAVVREYYRVEAIALQDPKAADVSTFKDVGISTALMDLQNWRSKFGLEGWHMTGQRTIEGVEVTEVDLTNKPKADPPVVPSVSFRLCVDSSGMDIIDKNGKSHTADDVPDRMIVPVTVANYDYPNGPWLVSYFTAQEIEAC